MECEDNDVFQQDDADVNAIDNSDEKDSTSQSKVTPIKSWLRKHMDSVKSPDHVPNKLSPEQKPLYIIPQVCIYLMILGKYSVKDIFFSKLSKILFFF